MVDLVDLVARGWAGGAGSGTSTSTVAVAVGVGTTTVGAGVTRSAVLTG